MSSRAREIILLILIGALAGIATFRLAAEGKIPLGSQVQNTQTRIVTSEESAVISAVDKTSPSVVAIGVKERIRTFNPFAPFSPINPQQPSQQQSTIGSGFVVGKNVIVTNRHVIAALGVDYTVVTKDGKNLSIQKIYRDPTLDLALIQVSGSVPSTLELGDSSKLKVGQTVIAIGNALGRFDNTVTTGVVSGLGRSVVAGDGFSGAEQLDNLIQTDAAINPGNSGGPLLNSSGQVIGLNVATTEGAQNIGFAIPINAVKAIINQFVTTGNVSRPFLGVRYQYLSLDQALRNDLAQGAYVEEVVQNSPADKAGIKQGDVITKIEGKKVDSEKVISSVVQSKKVGDSVKLTVETNGQGKDLVVTLAEYPSQ